MAGYHTEYAGMKFALLFMAEYANMFAVAAIASALFLGGWNSPFGEFLSGPVWGVFWVLSKGMTMVFVQMWLRWTLPRLRVDQLMYVGWNYYGTTRTLDQVMVQLRKKLGDNGAEPRYLVTVHGVGYKLILPKE